MMMRQNYFRSALSLLELVIVLAILGVVLALTLSAVQKARDAAFRISCGNNLRQLGLALHQYHEVFNSLPPGISHPDDTGPMKLPPDQFPLMRWHGRILPYIDQNNLWQQTVTAYAEDREYLSDPPHTGRTVWISVFLCPLEGRRTTPVGSPNNGIATTSYIGVAGVSHFRQDGVLYSDSRVSFADVTDGLSNTLLAGERPPDVNFEFGRWYSGSGDWLTAQSTLGVREVGVEDWIRGCPYGPYQFGPGSLLDPCSAFHFWSMHAMGANFLFADSSVHFLSYSIAPLMPALATRAGDESVSFQD